MRKKILAKRRAQVRRNKSLMVVYKKQSNLRLASSKSNADVKSIRSGNSQGN